MSKESINGNQGTTHFGYRNGKLYYFGKKSVLVMAPWPKPQAWFKAGPRMPWRSSRKQADRVLGYALFPKGEEHLHVPYFNLPPGMRLSEKDRRQQEGIKYLRQMQAKYCGAIPDEVRAELLRYSSRRWHLMCLFARCPGALDLSRSNPALCYALASNWVFHKPAVKRPQAAARRLIGKKQRQILGWLGFPATESARRLLQKVEHPALNILYLYGFRDLFGDEPLIRALSHMKTIDARMMRIVVKKRFRPLLTGRLLREIDEMPRDPNDNDWAFMVLQDAMNLAERPGMPRIGPIQSLRQLQAIHDELADADRMQWQNEGEERRNCAFGPPPFAGTENIRPILSTDDLYREGEAMAHCVGSYADQVLRGSSYVYQVLEPVRATLEIRCDPSSGRWFASQLRGMRNGAVPTDVAEQIYDRLYSSGSWVDEADVGAG